MSTHLEAVPFLVQGIEASLVTVLMLWSNGHIQHYGIINNSESSFIISSDENRACSELWGGGIGKIPLTLPSKIVLTFTYFFYFSKIKK